MEQKMICPHENCKRCIGYFNLHSTDIENSYYKILTNEPIKLKKKERYFHFTCKRCKNEIYILLGFKN